MKLFLECQRNNYLYVGHVLRVWFEGMPAAIGWPGGGTLGPLSPCCPHRDVVRSNPTHLDAEIPFWKVISGICRFGSYPTNSTPKDVDGCSREAITRGKMILYDLVSQEPQCHCMQFCQGTHAHKNAVQSSRVWTRRIAVQMPHGGGVASGSNVVQQKSTLSWSLDNER